MKFLSKEKALRRLKADSIKDLTPDQFDRFGYILHMVNPEVAKEFLKELPEFGKAAEHVVLEYFSFLEKAEEKSDENTKLIIRECTATADVLREKLKDPELSVEDQMLISDEIKKYIELSMQIDKVQRQYNLAIAKEGAKFALEVLAIVGPIIAGGVAAVLAAKNGGDDDSDNGNDNDYLDDYTDIEIDGDSDDSDY